MHILRRGNEKFTIKWLTSKLTHNCLQCSRTMTLVWSKPKNRICNIKGKCNVQSMPGIPSTTMSVSSITATLQLNEVYDYVIDIGFKLVSRKLWSGQSLMFSAQYTVLSCYFCWIFKYLQVYLSISLCWLVDIVVIYELSTPSRKQNTWKWSVVFLLDFFVSLSNQILIIRIMTRSLLEPIFDFCNICFRKSKFI